MTNSIDKQDVAEAIAEAMDDKIHERTGYVLAGSDSEEWGTVVIQAWPDGENAPPTDFLVRVTRLRSRR